MAWTERLVHEHSNDRVAALLSVDAQARLGHRRCRPYWIASESLSKVGGIRLSLRRLRLWLLESETKRMSIWAHLT
jgi:hypothetical protein